jgi:hypothetical protein
MTLILAIVARAERRGWGMPRTVVALWLASPAVLVAAVVEAVALQPDWLNLQGPASDRP